MDIIDKQIISNIRTLSVDMINEAGSGHPGICLGSAPIIYTLFAKHLNFSINDEKWVNRDRFVLSAGHGSALLYATMHLAGMSMMLDDLKKFRRLGSKTPGHPEYGITSGIEISTGPLGQGFASAVGMAMSGKILGQKYNVKGTGFGSKSIEYFNYHVYVLCGDGDLMEGVSYEAASLAGTLGLDNLIVLYDSNQISLDGETNKTFTESVIDRFSAQGWNIEVVKNGENVDEIDRAISKAKASNKPTLIEIKTVIGAGSLNQGQSVVHGKPLSTDDLSQLKIKFGMMDQPFYIHPDVMPNFRKKVIDRSGANYSNWATNFNQLLNNETIKQELASLSGRSNFIDVINMNWDFDANLKEATRVTNGWIMNKIAHKTDLLIGGSADLASSTNTYLKEMGDFSKTNYSGRNIWFGVREHAMGAILNGLALSGFKSFGSTFLVFSDYLKPAIRLASLMGLPVTYIFSHDSINIGADGATHQPIEQLAMLRSTPNLTVYRPYDIYELIGCWQLIINNNKGPSALILSRSEVGGLTRTNPLEVAKGGYIIKAEEGPIHAILIATGSEVQTALLIAKELQEKQINIRVVSMPSMEIFLNQPKEYQETILPNNVKRIVIEAGSSFGWHQFVSNSDCLITIDKFGTSGTKDEVLEYCNFTHQQIKERVLELLK